MRGERWALLFGLAACIASLALAFADPRAALTGWMGACVTLTAIPAGALCLQAMMKLIPGAWGEALRLTTEAACLLAFPAALAFVPVLLGIGVIYPWMRQPPINAFQALWLGPVQFGIRALLWFALLTGSAWLLRRRSKTRMVAVMTLLLFPLLGSLVAVDWLMSLTPRFASSGFGLQILILSVGLAYAVVLLFRLSLARRAVHIGVLGGLLLTLLLLWAYIQFVTFFIVWSAGLAEGAAWYGMRAGAWDGAEIAFGMLGGVPLLMLHLARIRTSAFWLRLLALTVILGKMIEFAWFALPGTGMIGVAAYALAAIGFAAIAWPGLAIALRRRVAARRPA